MDLEFYFIDTETTSGLVKQDGYQTVTRQVQHDKMYDQGLFVIKNNSFPISVNIKFIIKKAIRIIISPTRE